MATIKSKNAHAAKVFSGFGGLVEKEPLCGNHAAQIKNFRISRTGVLQTREGYRCIASFGGECIRGFWEGSVDGTARCFTAAGGFVRLMNFKSGNHPKIGTLGGVTGRVEFLLCEGKLYLLDGTQLQVFDSEDETFQPIKPYVPLLGYRWDPAALGSVKEPLNLLSDAVRIHYLNVLGIAEFSLPYPARQIDSVRIEGQSTTSYTLSSNGKTLTIPSATKSMNIEISYTMKTGSALCNTILNAPYGYVFARQQCETMLLSGKDRHLFVSAPVTSEMLAASCAIYPESLPLYFRAQDIFMLGDSTNPVTTFCPHYDGVLMMNRAHAWLLQEEKGELTVETVLDEIGSPHADAAAPISDSVLLLGRGNLKRLHSWVTRQADLEAENIRIPADFPASEALFARGVLFWNIEEDEVWLRDPQDDTGTVWVLRYDTGEWYRFENIRATCFFRYSDGIGFGNKFGDLFRFNKETTIDSLYMLSFLYESDAFDLGDASAPHRALSLTLCADLGEQTVELCVISGERSQAFTLKGKAGGGLEHFTLRPRIGRHRSICFRITGNASAPVKIFKLTCNANL